MFFLNELQGENCCECLNGSGSQLQAVFPAVLHLLAFFCKSREVSLGSGIYPGQASLTRGVLCCPFSPSVVFLS